MGKTSFCLNMAQHAAQREGETVGLFSLEMSRAQLALRLLCADARIDAHRLRTGKLTEKDWARLAKAYTDLSQAPIFIDDSATITPLEMRAKCRRLKAEHGLGLVIVDYLQLVTSGGRNEKPTAGALRDQSLDEGAGQGARGPGRGPLAALPRPRGPHGSAPCALGPEGIGSN